MTLFAIGVYDLKLTPDQFWELTPAQFQAISRRKEREHHAFEDVACFAAGIVASTILNMFRKKGASAIEASEFVPKRGKPKPPKRMTPEEMIAHFERLIPR